MSETKTDINLTPEELIFWQVSLAEYQRLTSLAEQSLAPIQNLLKQRYGLTELDRISADGVIIRAAKPQAEKAEDQ